MIPLDSRNLEPTVARLVMRNTLKIQSGLAHTDEEQERDSRGFFDNVKHGPPGP